MCCFGHCETFFGIKSAKTVAFVEITRQTFCWYAVAFLFSKAKKFVFLLWLFRQRKNTFLLFSSFVFQSWYYCGASIKKTGRNAKHNSLTWSKWHFRSATLPSKPEVWRVFWCLRCFKVWVHLQPSVSHPWTRKGVTLQNFKWIVALQNFRSPAKKWKVHRKNLIHSKSKQLHFNVA